jgi:opacity protein-like surface antigen
MKKIILASGIIFSAMTSIANAAEVSPYVSLKLGYVSIPETDIYYEGARVAGIRDMTGYEGSIANGLSFPISDVVSMRAEIEYLHVKAEEDSSSEPLSIAYNTFMINDYVDINIKSWVVSPYIGVGVGYTIGTEEVNNYDTGANGLTYGISMGVTYPMNSNLMFDLGAKYLNYNMAANADSGLTFDVSTWYYSLGARYKF